LIVLFRSRLTRVTGADYTAMPDEMPARARTMPGFVAFEHSMRTMASAWAARWYRWFAIEVAHVVRAYDSERLVQRVVSMRTASHPPNAPHPDGSDGPPRASRGPLGLVLSWEGCVR
jgi:hypothetical protein